MFRWSACNFLCLGATPSRISVNGCSRKLHMVAYKSTKGKGRASIGGATTASGRKSVQGRSFIYASGGASANFEPLSIWSEDTNLIKSWKFESDSNIGGNSDCTVSEEILTSENGVAEKVLRLSGKLEKSMDGKTPLMNMPLYSVFVSALGEFPKTLNLEGK